MIVKEREELIARQEKEEEELEGILDANKSVQTYFKDSRGQNIVAG
jgi:hypothetical protein